MRILILDDDPDRMIVLMKHLTRSDQLHCVSTPGECRYACVQSNWQNLNAGEGGCPAAQSCQTYGFNIPDVGLCVPD